MSEKKSNRAGSLIFFHQHDNFETLQLFKDMNSELYYREKEISFEEEEADIKNIVEQVWQNIDNDIDYNWFLADYKEEET